MNPNRYVTLVALLFGATCAWGCGSESEAATGSPALGYCDVEPVLADYCVRCHGDPPEHHAPFPLTSYAALQEEFPPGSGQVIWELIEQPVADDFMPFTGITLEPPVATLPPELKKRLLDWLAAGAPAGDLSACE
jgi:hypothetical protein